MKEESERATKPSLPAAACKVEILPLTFGQMQGSHSVCVCVCLYVRKGKAFNSEISSHNNVYCNMILLSHIFSKSQSDTSVILPLIPRKSVKLGSIRAYFFDVCWEQWTDAGLYASHVVKLESPEMAVLLSYF